MMHRPVPRLAPLSHRLAEAALASAPRRVRVESADPRMRTVLATVLRAAGYDAVGDEAAIDAIVLDARGDDAAIPFLARVREHDWATPVLVVISRGDMDTMEEARRLGATLVLPMPLEPEDLRDAMLAVVPPE